MGRDGRRPVGQEALHFAVFRWCQQGGKFWGGDRGPQVQPRWGLEGFMEEVSPVQGSGAHTRW